MFIPAKTKLERLIDRRFVRQIQATADEVTGPELVFVNGLEDLPTPVGGIITLLGATCYYFVGNVDLNGLRLVCGPNTCIRGTSSETSFIRSSGLTGTALISSAWTLPMQDISIETDIGVALDATANAGQALDWRAVNFINCNSIGTIKNYTNFIANDSAYLNSGGFTFDGTIGTISFFQCLFVGIAGATCISLPSTLTVSRRFRAYYSAFVVPSTGTGINANVAATFPTEGYILDHINFSGSGTYIVGVPYTDNKSLFTNNRGVGNSAEVSYYTMNANATATTIAATNTPVKVAGTTVSQSITQKFTNTDNRATYTGQLARSFAVRATVSCNSGNNHQVGVYIAKNGVVIDNSESYITTNGSGRAEQAKVQTVVELTTNDYIEVFVENASSVTDITVSELSVIVESLN